MNCGYCKSPYFSIESDTSSELVFRCNVCQARYTFSKLKSNDSYSWQDGVTVLSGVAALIQFLGVCDLADIYDHFD